MKKLHNKVSKILNEMNELKNDLFVQSLSHTEYADYSKAKELMAKFAMTVYMKMSKKQKES